MSGALLACGRNMNISTGYTFDDVLLVPKKSDIQSRDLIDLSVHLGKGIQLDIPVVSANMTNVTGPLMARTIASLGGLAILHRFVDTEEEFVKQFRNATDYDCNLFNHVGASVGVQERDRKWVDAIVGAGCRILCVDVAHGHHTNCLKMCEYIAQTYPSVLLIGGNVATPEGAVDLMNAGVDVGKCGCGGGSLCSTRIETGNGVPQLSALDDIYKSLNKCSMKILADGGLKKPGDLTKCLCFSHAVMLGNLLAGTDEAPGDIILVDGKQFKQYAGSSTHKSRHVEGVIGLVPYRGPVKQVILKLMEGLRSGMSYQGSVNLVELRNDPRFVAITNAGLIESKPHDVRY